MVKKIEKISEQRAEPSRPNKRVSENFASSEAGQIWDEIKDKELELFALPNQKVADHCEPVEVEPDTLYLLIRAHAVYPALEAACGSKYEVSMNEKFLTVARAKPLLWK